MKEELLEAMTGQRKRLEAELEQLRQELAKINGANREKVKKELKKFIQK